MPEGIEAGSAYVSIGAKMDEASLSAAKSKFSSAVSDMSSGVGGLKSSLGSELSASMSGIASSMGPVGSALSAIGPAGIVAGAGIAVVGSALSSSVTTAAGFQQQMAGVAAIMGSSGAELQAMSNAAREAGASTQFSASQAAEALSYMAGAGWDSQQATAGLKDTLTMAAAGGMDLASAGDMMTNTISQFNLEATDSGRVANVLAAGAAETNTNISQLGGGLKVVGATANAFGLSLESTTAALGSLSNAGIKGAEGGTALRGILAGLASQSGPAAEALAELGVSAEQINPATVGVAEAMSLLNEKGMTATQALQIFGRENVSAATYLAAHASSLGELETAITDTQKATEMAATMTDTYEGAMGELSSAVEEAEIALGSVLLPAVTEGIKLFTYGVTAVTDFGKAIYDTFDSARDAVNDAIGVDSGLNRWVNDLLGVDTGAAEAAGQDIADKVAEGIAESDDLKEAPGDALSSPEALVGAGDAGRDLAKSVSKEFIPYLEAGMKDLDILAMMNSQSTALNETFDRAFEYAGKSLRMHLSEGRSGNFWSLFSGDTLLGQSFGGNAAAAFQAITGLPAPEEGAAAYYRLMGNAAEAEKIELQQRLRATPVDLYTGEEQAAFKTQNEAIWANFGDSTAQIISDNFDYISQSGSDDAKAAMNVIMDAFAHPDASKFNAVSEALKGLTNELIDPAQAARLAADFEAAIMPQIADMKLFCQQQGEEMGQTITGSFSDAVLTADERDLIEGMEPMLNLLLEKAPEIGKEAGLNLIKEFIEAVKSGASTEELYNLMKSMFPEAAAKSNAALQDTVKATQAATVGYNQLQKAIEDCEACVMSDFGAWQEQQENLFNPSYIGAGGQAYLDWKNTVVSAANEAAMAVQAVGGKALGSAATPQSIPVSVTLDTSKATAALTEFEGTAKKDVQKPLDIDSSKATASLSEIDSTAKQTATKPLVIDSSQAMSAIAAINSAASQPVYKTIYVNEVYTGSSGGGGGGGGGNGYLGDYMLPPIFMARGGYVDRPTLAVVGESGPEYVIPAEKMARAASGGGGINITINSPIYGGSGDIEALLEQRNREIVAEITEQIAAARRGL